jgi:hypothetical protein
MENWADLSIDHEISVSQASEGTARSSRSRRFLRHSLGFWRGRTRAQAWLLTAAILFFLFANLSAAIAVLSCIPSVA